jgi:DNA repair exonuclease SbcCD ATPase subunit/DNA repair exonuclease SbcCD nuclease subunit
MTDITVLSKVSKSIENIFHLSDIHIRLYQRQEEYKEIFEKTFTYISKFPKKNNLIVVTGDILHSKIELSPECETLTIDFMNKLSDIYPTLFIAGNHDALLTNRNRLDSLSSIFYQRQKHNLFYLKNTGTYQYNNVLFYVDSLLDDDKIDMTVPIPDKTKIHVALFHGSIPGWKNTKGYTSEHGEKYMEDFVGMDYVLLGDIHMHQYMSIEKPVAAYAGSLISQNFGETDNNHGFLVWNLKNKKQEYVRIENRFRYQDVYLLPNNNLVTDNNEYTFDDIPIASNGHVKVFGLEDEIKSRIVFENLKTKWKHATFYFHTKEENTNIINDVKTNNNEFTEEEYIKEYVKENTPKEYFDMVFETIMKNYENFKTHNSKLQWKLLRIQFSNMFGYGSNNEICFSKNVSNQIIGIFGQNSSGKSTIIDVITTLLFDKNTRFNHGQTIPREVIHFGETEASGMIELMIGGDIYRIHKKYKMGEKIKQTTKFYIIREGKQEELTQEQRKKTNKFIEEMIGNFDKFIYTHCFLQQRENSFREMLPSVKKKFLNDLYGLNWFEKMEKLVKDTIKELETHVKISTEQMNKKSNLTFTKDFETIQNDMTDIVEKINTKKKEKNNISLDDLYQQLQLGSKYASFNEDYQQLETQTKLNDVKIKNYEKEQKEMELFIKTWKHNPFLLEFSEHSSHELFRKWSPSSCSISKWNTFYNDISKNKKEDYIDLQNRLKILYHNVCNDTITIDESILSSFPIDTKEDIKNKMKDFDEKNIQENLKQHYNELQHTTVDLQKNTLWNERNKETKKNIKQKEEQILEYQKKLDSFEKYNPFLKEENVKVYMKNHLQWNKNTIYKKYSPYFSTTKSLWTDYSKTIETSSSNLLKIRDEIKKIDTVLDTIQNDCPSYSRDELISKKEYVELKEKIKTSPYSCDRCNFVIEDSFQENLLQLKELDSTIFNLNNDIDFLQNNLKECHFEPNPDCPVCLKNPEYENRVIWEKKLLLKNKELKKKMTMKKKIFDTFHKTMKSVQDNHVDLYLEKKPSIESLNFLIKEKNDCIEKCKKETMEYNENRRKVENYENFVKCNDILKQKNNHLSQKEELHKKIEHLYFCIENKELFDYIETQWKWNHVLPKTILELKELFEEVEEDNETIKEILITVKNELFLEKKEWVDFDKKWKNDLTVFAKIKDLEDRVQCQEKYKLFLDEVAKKEKKDLNKHYQDEIKIVEQKQNNYNEWKENEELFNFLEKIWKDTSLWNVNGIEIQEKLNETEIKLKNVEIEKCLLLDQQKTLTMEKKCLKEKWQQDENIYKKMEILKTEKDKIEQEINNMEEKRVEIKMKETQLKVEIKNWEENKEQLYILQEKLKKEQLLLRLIDKDGLPLFLLKQKMKQMEVNMNQLIKHFLPDKEIRFVLDNKNIEFGTINKSDSKILCNYFGGMESFIIDLALKLTFTKFGVLPSSNFFIIDEGISVLDQQRQHNITFLFDFLSSITNNVLLISHIPQIRDFVNKSIHIEKNEGKSFVKFSLEK